MISKLFHLIAIVLGSVLNWTYENISFHNYGLAVIIFTIMVRLILLPMMIKQYKSSQKMKVIQPKLDELKKKYGNDMQKYQTEVAKLYQEMGENPLSGCLLLFVQLPVLWSLFYVVSKPLTYMRNMSAEEIARWVSLVPAEKRISGVYEQIAAVAHNNLLNMNFLGINLASIPKLELNRLLILPILATVATYLSMKFGMNNEAMDDKTKKSTDIFKFIGPIMTLMFSFKVPASLCIYWIIGSLIQIIQQWYLSKCIKDDSKFLESR